jgi:hypothetical protein
VAVVAGAIVVVVVVAVAAAVAVAGGSTAVRGAGLRVTSPGAIMAGGRQ